MHTSSTSRLFEETLKLLDSQSSGGTQSASAARKHGAAPSPLLGIYSSEASDNEDRLHQNMKKSML
jgi:hypothetical protein